MKYIVETGKKNKETGKTLVREFNNIAEAIEFSDKIKGKTGVAPAIRKIVYQIMTAEEIEMARRKIP